MPPFLGLARTRSFRLLHPLFCIYTEDKPHWHLVAICQLHNYICNPPRIAFRTAFEASQHLQERTDRGLILRQEVRRLPNGGACCVPPPAEACVHDTLEILRTHLLERRKLPITSIVDQHVQTPEVVHR